MKNSLRLPLAALLLGLVAAASQGDDLKAKFEAKRAQDPIAAFKMLAENPGGAQALARAALAKQIGEDVAAGLRAYGDNKAELVEKHFTRAALLADPYSPELSRQLMRILFLMKQARRMTTGCAACKGAGSSLCAACQNGMAVGNCPRCEAKGSVNCILCDGAGALNHHGYKGTLVLTVSNDFKAKDDLGRTGTMHAQKITYQMTPESGSGSFQLETDSTTNCTHFKGLNRKESVTQPCEKFWKEMKRFVFNGKAKIQVLNNKGQLAPLTPAAARRFFADYEICKSGKVPCDRCAGKKTETCALCSGKGQALQLCLKCEGTGTLACATCKGYGDASWLAKLLPIAPTLAAALNDQGAALREWLDDRARRATRQQDLARRLEEAKKGIDPTAKVTEDYVDIVCPKCKGNGSECEECWGAGRREYYEGTPQYERYALVKKLERQLAEAQKAPPPAPALALLPEAEPGGAVALNPKPAPQPGPDLGPRKPIAAPTIPKTVEETIKKADELHETGKAHLEKSKTSKDNAVWIDEAQKALVDLKQAQILYAAAQEKLDDMGASIPRDLLAKFRTNMEALVMARKQSP